ncbi:hypothetical protein DEU56DRAFT_774233 [Suillus clintonianus]|uniref:uncharacterized protein n=1 Tax=Suillus clintonianus TaxID=1904413 RepID=UPI001B87F6D8|nr:uncharacterized protein DEU56DRAFT_774233 [Suillus clintonianus]KAG2153291.1 hypothetical protein DEU56DRAFT_774233 [Suillus clintonianus]
MNEAPHPHPSHSSNHPIPAPLAGPGKRGMDEATLRKLSRAELQKLAKEHKVKANMKSAAIIRELGKLCNVAPLLQDEESEEPPKKKSRTTEENPPAAGPSTRIIDLPMATSRKYHASYHASRRSAINLTLWSADHPIIEEDAPTSVMLLTAEKITPIIAAGDAADSPPENLAGKSPRLSPVLESHTGHAAAEDVPSDSDSNLSHRSMNQEEYYKSPVSSRAGTPPPEEPQMLDRAVNIMKQITADDQRILVQIAALRQRAAALKEQAKNVRDVVRAEKGRRVRLEAYFAHWREIAPKWPKDWIYEEGEEDELRTARVLKNMTPPLPSIATGPRTLSFDGRDAPDSHRELRRRQLLPRQKARGQGNGAAARPTEVEQPLTGERANRLPSPQLTNNGRGTKRKHSA